MVLITAVRNLLCRRNRRRAFRARGNCRLRSLELRESVFCFKTAVRLSLGFMGMAPASAGRFAAGVNRKLLEKSAAAGMKLIRKPSQVGTTNFCRLCDLRSREVCLYRAPKDSRDDPLLVNRVGTRRTAYTVNVCESTVLGQTMSIAIFHRLTLGIA